MDVVRKEVEKCVVGPQTPLDAILYKLLSRGYCLIEEVPGLSKNLLLRTLARMLKLEFKRNRGLNGFQLSKRHQSKAMINHHTPHQVSAVYQTGWLQ